MSDMGDEYRDVKRYRQEQRRKYGIPCPGCAIKFPKANATILMPGQKCFCGYQDTRKRNER